MQTESYVTHYGLVIATVAMAFAFVLLAGGFYFKEVSKRYKEKVVAKLDFALPQLFMFTKADKLFQVNGLIAVALVIVAWWLTDSLVPALAVALLGGFAPSFVLKWMKKKRQSALTLQFPEFASLLASSLRAGSGLNLALNAIADELAQPLHQEISMLMREQKLGLSIDESLAGFALRTQLEDYSLMCAAIRISRSSGGNLADTLDSLASSSRRKLALEGKILSLTAQGKLQGWVMAALPFVIALALFQIEPIAMAPLISTWYGWAVVLVVVLLQLIGLHFIRRIVRIDI
jgi:tight adherence protein B